MTRPTRLAAILLLWVWVGPVTFAQTDSWRLLEVVGTPERASAESQVIPAGMAMAIEPNTVLMLHLRNGMVREGASSEEHSWTPRCTQPVSPPMPAGLPSAHRSGRNGERFARRWSPVLGGVPRLRRAHAALAELGRNAGRADPIRVHNRDSPSQWRSHRAERLAPGLPHGTAAFGRSLELQEPGPSRGIGKRWGNRLPSGRRRHRVRHIGTAFRRPCRWDHRAGSPRGCGGRRRPVRGLGPLAFNSKPKCSGRATSPPTLLGVHLTTRPFDRSRGCYVGDPLAVGRRLAEADASIAWQCGISGPAMCEGGNPTHGPTRSGCCGRALVGCGLPRT
jgi:hypothetical protein